MNELTKTNNDNKVRTTVFFPPEQLVQLEQIAKEEDRTVSQVVQRLVTSALEERNKPKGEGNV